jgi:hypothetical protein
MLDRQDLSLLLLLCALCALCDLCVSLSLRPSYLFATFFPPRSAPKNSPTGNVLITSLFSSHPRRAIFTPYRIKLKFPALCESVEITTFTPRSLHILKYTSFKSNRSGYELHSIATPCFAQAAKIFSMS